MRSTEPDQPADPADFPPELQEALRKMSERGSVVDMGTGDVVAENGRLATDQVMVACHECARAVALGWWGSTARHPGEPGIPVCVLCGEGEAVLMPAQWFAETIMLIQQNGSQRRTWRDDAVKGLGAIVLDEPPH
jgi:hypothetical protein